jgi:hypothetical protein
MVITAGDAAAVKPPTWLPHPQTRSNLTMHTATPTCPLAGSIAPTSYCTGSRNYTNYGREYLHGRADNRPLLPGVGRQLRRVLLHLLRDALGASVRNVASYSQCRGWDAQLRCSEQGVCAAGGGERTMRSPSLDQTVRWIVRVNFGAV